MARSTIHSLQPETDHDGMSRRLAVLACKSAIRTSFEGSLRNDYERQAALSEDAAADVEALPSYRLWSTTNKASQDRMWQILAAQVDSDYERIAKSAANATETPIGSLALGEVVDVPGYQSKSAIHGQPGGYMLDRDDDDLGAGVLYEAGGNIYALGRGIGAGDSKGERLIAHIRERYPDRSPVRILEMGCSAGAQSTDYPVAFPDATFHAIDLSPAMLRYAHARAELLGSRVHFHQQDSGATQFPDGHFDLIVSHNLFHEVAADYMPVILAECYRLLSPGGLCIHQDVPTQTERLDAYGQFVSEWQQDHNDEPFWIDFANADFKAMLESVGFDSETIRCEYLTALDAPIPWYVITAQK